MYYFWLTMILFDVSDWAVLLILWCTLFYSLGSIIFKLENKNHTHTKLLLPWFKISFSVVCSVLIYSQLAMLLNFELQIILSFWILNWMGALILDYPSDIHMQWCYTNSVGLQVGLIYDNAEWVSLKRDCCWQLSCFMTWAKLCC